MLIVLLPTAADDIWYTSRGLTNAVDPALQERTFKLIQTSVRNQDLIYFFRGFSMNPKATNALREFFETNYNSVGACFFALTFPCGSALIFPLPARD